MHHRGPQHFLEIYRYTFLDSILRCRFSERSEIFVTVNVLDRAQPALKIWGAKRMSDDFLGVDDSLDCDKKSQVLHTKSRRV